MLALRHARGIGLRRAGQLLAEYGSAFAAVEEGLRSPLAWSGKKLLPPDVARSFASEEWRPAAQEEWKALQRGDCCFLLWNDPGFPRLLKELPDSPLLLYFDGDTALLRSSVMAVVGARDCTREGIAVAAYLARELSQAGITIVSGMAKGIDRAAHLAALEGPGKSIAVLGTGIDVPYPQCNTDLYAELTARGLVLSEFAPGTAPAARHFPIRNRIISGLSLGVLVVEAADRSGSLITARLALEQGREVFAVPGHTMAAVSEGCRELIRKGAKAVFTADDILVELAPLLHAQLQERMSRQSEQKRNRQKARKRADAFDTALASQACAVLPQGSLPWIAPSPPAKTAKKSMAAPGAPVGPDSLPATDTATAGADNSGFSQPLAEEEKRLLAALGPAPVHIDALSQRLHMDAGRLSGMLAMLEVRGLVKRAPGMLYFVV